MSVVDDNKFEVGKVYYRLYLWKYPPGAHVTTSWVYEGEGPDARANESRGKRLPPGFWFMQWESWLDQKNAEDPAIVPLRIGFTSRASAKKAMLTWDEFLQALMDLNRIELHGTQFTLLAETGQVAALARVQIVTTSANPQEGTFSIRGTLLDGTPEPKRVALVMLGNGMSITFRVIGVDCTKGTDMDLVSLTCRGSAEEVEVWSHLALEGRRLDVLETKWGLWIEPDSSDSDQHGR